MMMPMLMMLAEVSPEVKLLESLKKAVSDYEQEIKMGGGSNHKKMELIFYLQLMILKMKPEEMSTPEMMKRYEEHKRWMELKPNGQ